MAWELDATTEEIVLLNEAGQETNRIDLHAIVEAWLLDEKPAGG